MKNIIDASVEFYYQGERYSPAATIELDPYINREGGLPQLQQILAKLNHIDLMSYQYEVMLGEDVQINNAQGLVANFVTEGRLDEAGFIQAWHEQKMFDQLQAIAQQHLGIADLGENPELKDALAAAFTLGKETR
jgi:hypothetical protein